MIRFENVSLRYSAATHNSGHAYTQNGGSAKPRSSLFSRSSKAGQAPAGGSQPAVLHNINLNLERGSFHFITGVSGAGKTSLLKLIHLALRPTSGKVFVAGQDTTLMDADERARMRRRIGFVFQDYRLLDHLSVEDNVALPLKIAGTYDKQRRNDVLDLLTWVGLGDKMSAELETLSGGQKQRVALARAVITRPQLLLADEPTGNLDDGMGMRLVRLFVELNRIGTTVIIATHNRELLTTFGSFPVINLEGGQAVLGRTGVSEMNTPNPTQRSNLVFSNTPQPDVG